MFFIFIIQAGKPTEAVKACTEALKIYPDDVDMFCERGDAHISNENFDDGMKVFFFNDRIWFFIQFIKRLCNCC